jgi:rhodanese-related sulfurtransferase
MAAADLYENLNDGDAENDPYIISLRSAEDYAKGHIPGAVNMTVKEMFSEANLATIPPDRQVVVVCYTGQTAGQATAGLSMLGYDAYSLLFGMSSWTSDPDVYVTRFDPDVHANDYAVETEANETGGPYPSPGPLAPGVRGAAEAYFAVGIKTIGASDLYDHLNDGDPENDPYIISLRSAEDYAKGHIPGAVNMNVKEMFSAESLASIPCDRQVVVVCYTGQTAAQATAGLNMLGYDAHSLLCGMSSWTSDPEVFVKRFDPEVHAGDYTVELKANAPGGPYELPFAVTTTAAVGVQGAAEAYYSTGPRTIGAADVYENLNDGDQENDPYIISLRSAEDYARGHIPGAVNMSVKEMFSAGSLATIPPDRQVVVVCYTGQTAGQATAGLSMLGYDAYSLLFGMSSWTGDPDVFVKRFDPEVHTSDYTVETKSTEAGGPFAGPIPLAGSVAGAVEAYFGGGPRTIGAGDVYGNLNDGDPENDPTIISLRSAEDYARGHIPGAVNMSVTEMFSTDNLATIPPDRQVVVVCYTGQTAAQATAGLNMLGYDAYSLLFGMSSWTPDPDVFVKRFSPEVHTGDYPIDLEPREPGGPYELPVPLAGPDIGACPSDAARPALDALVPATHAEAESCITCHTDESTLRALAVEEEEEKTSEESSGEG